MQVLVLRAEGVPLQVVGVEEVVLVVQSESLPRRPCLLTAEKLQTNQAMIPTACEVFAWFMHAVQMRVSQPPEAARP